MCQLFVRQTSNVGWKRKNPSSIASIDDLSLARTEASLSLCSVVCDNLPHPSNVCEFLPENVENVIM